MTTKIKWRLKERPTPDEVSMLFTQGLLTKEEAREILFSLENDEERDKESLKEEIKFLRELVQTLSTKTQIIQQIEYVQKPYYQYDWYKPYLVYCNNTLLSSTAGSNTMTLTGGTGMSTAAYSYTNSADDSFTGITTF